MVLEVEYFTLYGSLPHRHLSNHSTCFHGAGCSGILGALFCRPVYEQADRSPWQRLNTTMALFLEFISQQWTLVAALAVVLTMLFFHESRKSGPSLSPQQAISLVNAQSGLFIDLRDASDYKAGHIVEAMHIPAAKLQSRLAELEKHKNEPIVLVCKMGQQAGAAGKTLKASGFEHVYKMTGGMMEWSNLQLPTISKS